MCGLSVTVDSTADSTSAVTANAITIRPDRQDPFSRGSMCPKAPMLAELHCDSERIRHPLKKVGSDWVEISWDEALDTVIEQFNKIRNEHSADAIASYLGNPIVHNLGMMLYIKQLTRAIGSRNVFSATSMDQLPHHFAAHYMFGHEFRIPVPDVNRTDYMIVLGANPIASNGSIMTSAGIRERLKALKERGGKLVVIDPRRTETAEMATTHCFINPGTDVFLLLAFLHQLFAGNHLAPGRLSEYLPTDSIKTLKQLSQRFSPEVVAVTTGITADKIRHLVADYMQQTRAVIYGRMGVSTQRHGGLCHWLINTINIVSGHFDTTGGMMFPRPAIELARGRNQPDSLNRWHSRVRGLPEFYGEYPVSAMTEEMLTPGPGQVRGMLTVCGNPVLSTPNGKRLEEALPALDFMVSVDNYINETTRHANIILPTPSGLEIDHYDIIFNLISVSNNVKFSEALFPVDTDRLYDWQILKRLIAGLTEKKASLIEKAALHISTPRRVINWGLMLGAYGCLSHPRRWFKGLSLKRVIQTKHGIDLGPLEPRVPEGLLTDDRMIHLTPKVFTEAVEALEVPSVASDEFPLQLIGRRHVNTNNSWMHQFRKLVNSRQVRCTAMMNPSDATARTIGDGALVRVSSATGSIELNAEVTDSIMSGVVCIPHGFGHHGNGTRISNALVKPGASVNDITSEQHFDLVTGNAAFSGLPLQIVKIADAPESEAPSDDTILTGLPMLILYGSRTGNAEYLAHECKALALDVGLLPTVLPMTEVTPSEIASSERLLMICSTYGDGDMPDNAYDLWQSLQQTDAVSLSNTGFAVLALGDRAYDTFCEAGKAWDMQLEKLGAERLVERIDCDTDFEIQARDWITSTLPTLGTHGDQKPVSVALSELRKASAADAPAGINRGSPWPAQVLDKRVLSGKGSTQEVVHYALSINDAGWSYQPGDSVNLIVKNTSANIDALLNLFNNSKPANQTTIPENTLREKLTELEWVRPSRKLLQHLASRLAKRHAKELTDALASADVNQLDLWINGRDVQDLVADYPTAFIDIQELLPLLIPVQARAYSIASSPLAYAEEIHLTVATVRRRDNDRDYAGFASGYLADSMEPGSTVNLYPAPQTGFSLPEDSQAPVIMIGPGTGLAPFRGFLQHRAQQKTAGISIGDSWLFFGNPHRETDYLYQAEIEAYLDDGILTRIDLAFSRDQSDKVYVQHRLISAGEEFVSWLKRGAFVYICGDASRMAADVDQAIKSVLIEHDKHSTETATEFLKDLKSTGRYLLDVY